MKDLESIPDQLHDLSGAEKEPLPPTMFARLVSTIHAAHRTAPYPWWHVEAEHCQVSPWIARAVLEALREPTGEMLRASYHAVTRRTLGNQMLELATPRDAHDLKSRLRMRAMIDAALADARTHSSPLLTAEEGPGCKPPTSS